ncbi:chromatin associated protein [Mycena alexandri]|uniref:Chromatin associated protein n=1 Tax=Mycena alexandri TaxID=1745969 RepID=A0AAD6WT10_9AGAR|nr:chromatin associated protein [Mycena alexandri]
MASGSIYQHRAMGPGGVPPQDGPIYNSRGLADTLDRIKQEFEVLAGELNISRDQRERYESTIASQADELEKIRQALHNLEAQHTKVRQQYEYELRMLRSEAHAARQPQPQPQPRPSSAIPTLSSPSMFMGGASTHSPVLDSHHSLSARDRESRERDIQRARFLEGSNKRIKLDQPESNRLPLIGPGSSPSSRRAPTPAVPAPPPPPPPAQQSYLNDFLNNLELSTIHPDWKKEGSDWFVIYNPKVKRTLDVSLIHTFIHETVVCCIQFSGDGKYLATGCNRTAQIYDVQTGRKICVLADEGSSKTGDLYIRSVRFSPDGRFLATGAEDERIRVWDIDKRSIRVIFEGHHQDIYSLDFSLDGRRLVSGSGDASVRIWDMDNQTPARVLTAQPESDASDDDAGVMAVAISPDGTLIAAGCVDALVRVWSVSSGALVDILRGHQNSVHSVVFTRDGAGLVSGALDNTIRCWDLRAKSKKDGVPCTVFAGHKDYVLSVGISRDAQWIVSGSKDRGVHFWDSAGVVQCMLQGHKNSVISTSLHPVGNLLATGSGDKLARIWNYNTV